MAKDDNEAHSIAGVRLKGSVLAVCNSGSEGNRCSDIDQHLKDRLTMLRIDRT